MTDEGSEQPAEAVKSIEDGIAEAVRGLESLIKRKSFDAPLTDAIARAELVSFDLFDTLSRRPFLEPGHLFAWMETNAALSGFAAQRLAAEKAARQHRRDRSDVTLAQIHELLPGYDALDVERLAEVELAYPRARVSNAFRIMKSAGKPLAIVTDTYLDRGIIEAIIDKIGTSPDHLVISCEDDTTKCGGSSYRRLMQASRLGAASILHLGDSLVGDFENPARRGIASVLIHRDLPSMFAKPELAQLSQDRSLAASMAAAAIRDWLEDLPAARRTLR